jgi:tRNA modification GTPase
MSALSPSHKGRDDTIAALATPPGPGARAIVRISGPGAANVVSTVFRPMTPVALDRRLCTPGVLHLPELTADLSADLFFWPAPGSYTGQNLAELHLISSPPLVELLIARLLQSGARAAGPGEFTLRAFLSGKLDLTRAEAVHGVIEAHDRSELKQALGQLAGGLGRPLQELREDLLNLLADLEAGLDFADEDITFVDQKDLLLRIGRALAAVTLAEKQLRGRALADRPFRVVLTGRPNAGKSSLFNALADADALVSARPGTTRDYLTRTLAMDGVPVELIDTPGRQDAANHIESQAQSLRGEQSENADLLLLCVCVTTEPDAEERALSARRASEGSFPAALPVWTQCDRGPALPGWLAASAVTGEGIAALKAEIGRIAKGRAQPALAPSLSRCRSHVESCLAHLRAAHALVLYEDPPELLALELREALEQLGEMVGAVYTDDLLDRVFSRFCIGK